MTPLIHAFPNASHDKQTKKPITLRDATISPYRVVTRNLSTKLHLTHCSRGLSVVFVTARARRLLWSCRRRGYHPSLDRRRTPEARPGVRVFCAHLCQRTLRWRTFSAVRVAFECGRHNCRRAVVFVVVVFGFVVCFFFYSLTVSGVFYCVIREFLANIACVCGSCHRSTRLVSIDSLRVADEGSAGADLCVCCPVVVYLGC